MTIYFDVIAKLLCSSFTVYIRRAIYWFQYEPSIISNLAILLSFYSASKFSLLSQSIERNESIYVSATLRFIALTRNCTMMSILQTKIVFSDADLEGHINKQNCPFLGLRNPNHDLIEANASITSDCLVRSVA